MWTFRAMNTDVTVAAPSLDDRLEHELARDVAVLFEDTERRFSRFRPDSELSQLNRATEPIVVSAGMLDLLLRAREHVASTQGIFDPTIGAALVAAGYDRSFEPGALDRDAGERVRASRFDELELDGDRVYRPPHVQVDFGGFLKGLTVDRATQLTSSPMLIDAGGDAALTGAGDDDGGWLVDVEDPGDAERIVATLRVRDRAVATSAANRRCWRVGDTIAHHLIDPRTGVPAQSDLAQVTVVADTAERADVLAKSAFVLGRDAGLMFLSSLPGVAAMLVLRNGFLVEIGDIVHA